jgi:hypothetical protein
MSKWIGFDYRVLLNNVAIIDKGYVVVVRIGGVIYLMIGGVKSFVCSVVLCIASLAAWLCFWKWN